LLWKQMGWGWEDGQRYGHYSVSVSPFDYQPSTDTLTYYTDVKLMLTVGEPEPTMSEIEEPTRSETRAVTPPAQINEGTELLVITYASYQDDIASYINWNKEKGVVVTMVTMTQVDSFSPALDDSSSIWKYVHDTYFGDGQNLKYLLLVGEHTRVASREVKDLDPYGNEPDILRSDTYFGCLDGSYTNWNSDGDGNWGEVSDIQDFIPEVFVSRIAVDSDTEAKGWAAKTVAYEKDPVVGGWGGTAAFFGSYTHEYDDGPKHSEYLWDHYLDSVYPTIDRYYSNGPTKSATGAKLLNKNNARNGVNSGVSIIVYMGHGHWGMWTEGPNTAPTEIFTIYDAADFQQSPKLPFISAMSCETNWFDGKEAISEMFTENSKGGAIAYGGATRTTEGSISHGYLIGAPGIQEDTLRMLKQGYRTPAEVFHRAKAHYVQEWGAYFNSYQFGFNAWMEHQVLGSPNVPLWTSTPKTLNVQYDFTEDYYSNFTVSVKDGQNNALKDAKVTIYSEALDHWSFVLTNYLGQAKVPFEITETAYGKITVSKDGYKPFQEQVVLRDRTEPETIPTCERPNPDGSNGWYVKDPILTFICSEPADIYFKWNQGSVEDYYEGTIPVPKGDNVLDYWGEDDSGNEEDRKYYTLKYDPDTPIMTVTIFPEESDGKSGWYVTQPVVTTELTDSDGSPQRVEYWWGRGSKEISNGTIFPPQDDNELYIQAVDEAGNRGEELEYYFKVDSIKPFTEHNTGGIDPNERGWYISPMTISLSSDDRRSYIYYKWDESFEWEKYSTEITPLSGNHTLYYFSEDDHGNQEEVRSFQIAYDIMAPQLEIEIEPRSPDGSAGWYITEPTVSLDVIFENNPYRIFYFFKGDEAREYSSSIDIPEGESTLYCYAEDEAGNRGILQELDFKVDTDPETTNDYLDLSTNDEGWYTDLPQITLSTTEGITIYYSWDGYSGFEKYNGALFPPEEEGIFNLFYYSLDKAGNKENEKTLTLPVDTKAPEIIATYPLSASNGEEVTFDMTDTTDGIGVEAYFIDFGDGTDSGWGVNPQISHKYSSGGTFKVKMKARDAVGHESEEKITSIEVQSSVDLTLIIIIGGGALVLIILLVILLAAVISRRRHHHYAHHPVHPIPPPGQIQARSHPQQQMRPQPPRQQVAQAPVQKQLPQRAPVSKPAMEIPRPPPPPAVPPPPKPPV